MFASDSILPNPPPGAVAVLHDREYRVRAFRIGSKEMVIQGAVRDQKPAGLYLSDDPHPMAVHHMQLQLSVSFPELVITDVTTEFLTYPTVTCPNIIDHYDKLIGLSIARGFNQNVRDLFGGPRGCTHTTALLLAMAPVAMQTFWSMQAAEQMGAAAHANGDNTGTGNDDRNGLPKQFPTSDQSDAWKRNVNTCHVWIEDGAEVAARRAGEPWAEPVFMKQHFAKHGLPRAADA